MSGLFHVLGNAGQALSAQQQVIAVIGQNIENVNTEGYSRKEVILQNLGEVGAGNNLSFLGLDASVVVQMRNQLLDKQVVNALSASGYLEAQELSWKDIEAVLSENIDRSDDTPSLEAAQGNNNYPQGLSKGLDDLMRAFLEWAALPTSLGNKQMVLAQAGTLVANFNQISGQLDQLSEDISLQQGADLDSANSLLSEIARLNAQIARIDAQPGHYALDERDNRQRALERLATFMSFEIQPSSMGNGQIAVIARDPSLNPITLLDGGIVGTPITLSAGDYVVGSSAMALTGGSLQSHQAMLTAQLVQMQQSLDALANQMVTSVNQAYNPSGAGNNFFQSSALTASTLALDSTLSASSLTATLTANGGANEIANALGLVFSQTFSTSQGDAINGTFSDSWASTVAWVGGNVRSTLDQAGYQEQIKNSLRNERSNVIGVSLDSEMVDFMQAQRAFEGVAKVIRIADELLSVIVNDLIR